MPRPWIRNAIGWYRKDDAFIYRGDFRLRIHSVRRQAVGVREYVWEIGFEKGMAHGYAGHRSFTKAFLKAWWATYMRYLEWDDHPPAFVPKFMHRAILR
jgi:hypothetical protein